MIRPFSILCSHFIRCSILPPFIHKSSFTSSLSVSCLRQPRISSELKLKHHEEVETPKLAVLKRKVEDFGIKTQDMTAPGLYNVLFCPKCAGGPKAERSLSFHIVESGELAMWRCFRGECGWVGQVFADGRESYDGFNISRNVHSLGQMTEESLGLQPLGSKLLDYFVERMISEETLSRNGVRQVGRDQLVLSYLMRSTKGRLAKLMPTKQEVMAFTYRKNGQILGCKYRTIEKKFWQEKGTERILYGLDDIVSADEIIMVEGELDKLSVEEAGFVNCVSVPGGAPGKVSSKELPSMEKDAAFQYLWNCRDYLDKISRIILATDNDQPGHALAEELARRLGKERCWQVCWPEKDKVNSFKDANEVLMHLGPVGLREIMEKAEIYQTHPTIRVGSCSCL